MKRIAFGAACFAAGILVAWLLLFSSSASTSTANQVAKAEEASSNTTEAQASKRRSHATRATVEGMQDRDDNGTAAHEVNAASEPQPAANGGARRPESIDAPAEDDDDSPAPALTAEEAAPSAPTDPHEGGETAVNLNPPLGTIRGFVRVLGALYGPFRGVHNQRDPRCPEFKKTSDTEIVIGADHRLRNALVYIDDLPKDASTPASDVPVRLAMKNCLFAPYAVALQPGQVLTVFNEDGLLHEVHDDGSFRYALPENRMMARPIRSTDGEAVVSRRTLRCDIHDESADLYVVAHPYFDVTREDGAFAIHGLQDGLYSLSAMHSMLGKVSGGAIELRNGFARGDATITFDLSTAHRNLRVLADTGRVLENGMKSLAKGLGVKCDACHVKGIWEDDSRQGKVEARAFLSATIGERRNEKRELALSGLLTALKLREPKSEAQVWRAVDAFTKMPRQVDPL
jgi:hypothetical protein